MLMWFSGDIMKAQDCGIWRLLGAIYHVSPIDHFDTWRKVLPLTRPSIKTWVPTGPVTFTAYPSKAEKRETSIIAWVFHVSTCLTHVAYLIGSWGFLWFLKFKIGVSVSDIQNLRNFREGLRRFEMKTDWLTDWLTEWMQHSPSR